MPFERKRYIHFFCSIYSFRKRFDLLNSKALTKIQAVLLVAVIAVALVATAAYVLLSEEDQITETIKIGICADLDSTGGSAIKQGAMLAAEQVNAEKGVLGRNFEIVAQDDDSETSVDITVATNALARLITVDEADFVITHSIGEVRFNYLEIASEHEKILFTVNDLTEDLTQDVLDNYDRYKYFFRAGWGNETAATMGMAESIAVCRNYTGFNKIAFIYPYGFEVLVSPVIDVLDECGFDVVLTQSFSWGTIDFSSYFAKAEAAGAEILYPMIFDSAGISFVKEYCDRQSPMVMWGKVEIAESSDFWQLTEGKCEHISTGGYPVVAGYPLTTKTMPTREAYFERWGEEISSLAAATYDVVSFILADAIERAGTIDTDAVIEALEETDVETSSAQRFVFTSSHDIMVGEAAPNRPDENYMLVCVFQWQNGEMVPVYPVEIGEEVGATYTFPPWDGPWNKE